MSKILKSKSGWENRIYIGTRSVFSCHVETVCLLVRKELPPDTEYVYIDYEVPEDTVVPYRATYQDIKDWVFENYGMKVHTLFISQVKDKCGLEKERNGNKEDRKHPQRHVTPEKEEAIMAALKHFKMI